MAENELTTAADVNGLMEFYGSEAGEAEERFRSSVSEMKLVPKLKMNKDTLDTALTLGDTNVSRRQWYFTFVDVFGTRSLWPPEKDKTEWGKRPVCSIGFTDPNTFRNGSETASGKWLINESYPHPYDRGEVKVGDMLSFECKRCPWNRFESRNEWEHKDSSSKAKACNESRAFFVRPMVRGRQLPIANEDIFEFAPDPIVDKFALMNVSMGTNRGAIEEIFLKSAARKIPVPAAVFKMTIKKNDSGGFTFASMVIEFAGIVSRDTFVNIIKPLSKEVREFAARNSNVVLTDDDIPI